MTGPAIWSLRRRPPRLGKHRTLPTITETDMPPASPAASLPQHDYRTTAELQQAALKPAFDPPADPYRQVQCTFCGAIGLAADMPDHGRGPRCYPDTEGCGHRWAAGKPVSLLPHGAEPLEPLPEPEPALPPAQEEALAAFNEAHDEHDAETLSEDEEPTPPSDAEEAQAEIRREAIEALRGPLAEPEPQDGGEAE